MALLEISYDDFDTTCYSIQHNLIKLIEHAINIGVQVNINTGNIEQAEQKIEEAGTEAHDAYLLAQNLNERMTAVETRLNAIWNDTALFKSSPLNDRIEAIEDQL